MAKRQVEVFTAGCPVCEPAVKMVNELACPDCEVTVHDLSRQKHDLVGRYGIKTLPAIVVDGSLLGCCRNAGPDMGELQAAGVGSGRPSSLS
ncbi:MAG: glutaredoxin family protein [Actinomycetota bacterium]